ncbi:formylglycine-generating enzyme family protein [Caenispirillum bisanense]|uniref:Formylglycine-generating enzyme, required for sulfatase activity, contains SUMF1/FGE domain n=1 Tax=Caenispirillum bisanense TaxID=414052 RepID=A0A286GZH6_9PROT|nr:SUMF1/EgtB/PvdO family nonheme iron enzyme [Caenispirillum bisanense]SOE00464.1 Formylglycine-generating enzyme, required for sulfatase activity, contains SUMF1/FGE domain [Caenispirillum bisanense]
MRRRLAAAAAGVLLMAAFPAAAGEPFRDCPACPEMVAVPPGTFTLGDARVPDAAPREATVVRPFAIGRTEVTWRQWGACVAEGACRGGQDDHGWGRGDRPVINVSLADAEAYVAWLSARTGHTYRLPSEVEWEWAARAGTTTLYPWGEAMTEGRANCRGCDGPIVEHGGSFAVGNYPANAWGLLDTAGNLWELTADCWTADGAPSGAQEPWQPDPACRDRVMRGGAWYYVPLLSASASRARNAADVWSYVVGFRVVRELE